MAHPDRNIFVDEIQTREKIIILKHARELRLSTAHQISKASRGTISVSDVSASALVTELADFGVECDVIDLPTITQMGDAAFVEHLNVIRVTDQMLVVRAAIADLDAAKMARFNIEHVLTNFGGRAVLAAA